MKPISIKSDDYSGVPGWEDNPVRTILKVHAPKGWPGGGIYLTGAGYRFVSETGTLTTDGGTHIDLSRSEAQRLIDALTVAIEAAEAEGRSS